MTFLAAFESRFPVGSSAKTIDGLFINNEYGPITSFVKDLGITNEKGYIIADDNGKTKIIPITGISKNNIKTMPFPIATPRCCFTNLMLSSYLKWRSNV